MYGETTGRTTIARGEHGDRRGRTRQRIIRTLTFWLRPQFVLRVVSRFQKVVGFDRAVALASSALTAVIPLAIIASSISSSLGGRTPPTASSTAMG